MNPPQTSEEAQAWLDARDVRLGLGLKQFLLSHYFEIFPSAIHLPALRALTPEALIALCPERDADRDGGRPHPCRALKAWKLFKALGLPQDHPEYAGALVNLEHALRAALGVAAGDSSLTVNASALAYIEITAFERLAGDYAKLPEELPHPASVCFEYHPGGALFRITFTEDFTRGTLQSRQESALALAVLEYAYWEILRKTHPESETRNLSAPEIFMESGSGLCKQPPAIAQRQIEKFAGRINALIEAMVNTALEESTYTEASIKTFYAQRLGDFFAQIFDSIERAHGHHASAASAKGA